MEHTPQVPATSGAAAAPASPPRRTPRGSLRIRWTAALLVSVLVPLSALAVLTVRIQRDGLETAEKSLEVAVIDHVGSSLDDELDQASEGVRRAARALSDARIESDELRLDLAREALARTPVLAQVEIYGADGAFIDAITRTEGPAAGSAAPSAAPNARAAAPQGPRASRAMLEASDPEGSWAEPEFAPNAVYLRFVAPMRAGDERTGWAVGVVAASVLSERVQTISQAHFNRPDRVVVLDDQLRVLLAPGRDAPSTGRSLQGQDIFSVARIPPGAFHGNFGISTEFDSAAGRMVGTVRTLPGRAWAVAVRRPEAEAFAALLRARRAFGIAAAALALFAVAVGSWIATRTVRPVKRLVDLTRAYARREFTRKSDVRTGDELEQLGGSLEDMAQALAQSEQEIDRRARAQTNLSRFLPAEVATRVAEGGASALRLGGERRTVSVLFADVVAFTPFAEGAPPEKVVAFLNELFTVLSEVVFRHEGTIDKFIGDCIMAVFGAPNDMADHTQRALEAAEDMHRFVEASRENWEKTYGISVSLGIGVSSGEVLVGNLGSEARMEYTAIGDAVNVGARLEALARPGQTLVTAEVARAAGTGFQFGSLGAHALRGKRAPVEVMELL